MDLKSKRYNRIFHPETLALGLGYNPALSEGAVKPPVFLTSTFQFADSAEGKRFFEEAYGLNEEPLGQAMGLIYSRLNNPNLQILEERIAAWEHVDKAAAFASGMAAITTTMLSLLRPGDVVLCTQPVYGGTHFLLHQILPAYGIQTLFVMAGDDAPARMRELGQAQKGKVRLLFVETPANPSNVMTDIAETLAVAKELSGEREVVVAVDNTFLGPVFQAPGRLGAHLVIYSATKFIGGHSDAVAGIVCGRADLMEQVLLYRTIMGTMAAPFTAWLLTRSLETVSIRMRRQAKNAQALAQLLVSHPAVRSVSYPDLFDPESSQGRIYAHQCSGPGSLISFEVEGGEAEAFAVLDAFEVMRLAVSLGGTESLVEHPLRMTHADVPPEELGTYGVSESMIRMSVGLEHVNDLKRDLLGALGVLNRTSPNRDTEDE